MAHANLENQARPTRVLLVDDDVELCELLSTYLMADGFQVSTAHDGQAAVRAARAGNLDLIVMDITMPVLDGFEALRQMRTFSNVPVLMLTARGDEVDRIVGLELGADDYLPKPFNSRELAARLRAILRRTRVGPEPAGASAGRFVLDDLVLRPGARSVERSGEEVPLTATEFTIVELLIRSAGTVVSKDELSKRALGRRLLPHDRSLDTHIGNLRKKLGPRHDGSLRIKTVRSRGYVFVTV